MNTSQPPQGDFPCCATPARPGPTAVWVRVEDDPGSCCRSPHPRWEIKNPHGDGKNYLCTDEVIRAYGRAHVEGFLLRDLPPLPEEAWAADPGSRS